MGEMKGPAGTIQRRADEEESDVILWNGVDGLWTSDNCVNIF